MDSDEKVAEEFGYNAFEQWNYRQIVFPLEDLEKKTWLSMSQSFYWSSKVLVEGVANGNLREDIEGRAAIFLFRHYLELILKEIILAGRYLTTDGGITQEEVKQIKCGHNLSELWQTVLKDAKPKMPADTPWDTYDHDFAGKCIIELSDADTKGFAFRYDGQGGERAHIEFDRMLIAMEHVSQVLEGILTVLGERRGEIQDWLDQLRSEAGW